MRTTTSQQLSFGDGFINPSLYELDEELKRVDQLLSQKKSLKPFEDVFSETSAKQSCSNSIRVRRGGLRFVERFLQISIVVKFEAT